MAKRCAITGKGVLVGNNVSHANNKSRRRFLPNLQEITMLSDTLGNVRMRITTNAIRTIEKNGGIDAYLLTARDTALTTESRQLKRRLQKAQEKAAV
ncbi:MAG: 50S ribosomal protein L28 [Alphaproteobacteria bacterium]|nr:50S ribosomal protein L28 [Alphaproteobacteria bacterium]MBU0797254.1 50S ribosomal protein L28 [Alphaproteobacteria bacterium]MBU0888958.1 50S ribosomal protein L28 [Alphaproteobacteria bacterium]MBU1813978.1 50S ribosomal protein L28 [Alphaproteobacteria bacterium]MBU2090212.1 50S ribosomal protein L28 [Alphaproteobacteria bacterium]